MLLKGQAQKPMLAISCYLYKLLSTTSYVYCKTLRIKAYSDTLKKHLYGFLVYSKKKLFNCLMIWAI